MKKYLSLLLTIALCLALCACGSANEPAAEPATEPTEAPAVMPNPVKEVTAEEQGTLAGLTLNAPEGAEKVVWSVIETEPVIAQVVFMVDDVIYVYRAQPTAETSLDSEEIAALSGMYYDFDKVEDTEVTGRVARLSSIESAAVLEWLDIVPGIAYSLSTTESGDTAKLAEIAELVFAPVQGEAEGDAPIGMPNPMTEVDADGQLEGTGLSLDAPEGAEELVRFVIQGGDEPAMAETRFTLDGVEYCYRAQPTAELESVDISGMFYEWSVTEECEVSHCSGTVCANDEVSVVYWLDIVPGVAYSLSTSDSADTAAIVEVANLAFVPSQGNVG